MKKIIKGLIISALILLFVFLSIMLIIFNENLSDYSNSIMIILTAAYGITTIAIWVANYHSANASKAQLEESKRQFEESKRLEMMPCFGIKISEAPVPNYAMEVDITADGEGEVAYRDMQVIFQNIGKGLARNVSCKFTSDFVESKDILNSPILPINSETGINLIFCGKINHLQERVLPSTALFELMFEDLLDNKYKQNIQIEFFILDEDSNLQHGESKKILYVKEKKIFSPTIIPTEEAENV